jgi:hypothetical protein
VLDGGRQPVTDDWQPAARSPRGIFPLSPDAVKRDSRCCPRVLVML